MSYLAKPFSITMVFTVKIEMMNDTVLLYSLPEEEKDRLQHWLNDRSSGYKNISHSFIGFHALPERYVLVRVNDIARLVIQCDYIDNSSRITEYYDNFNVIPEANKNIENIDEEFQNDPEFLDFLLDHFYPEIIIKMKGKKEPIIYSGIDENENCLAILRGDLVLHHMDKSGYLKVMDEDGEENFIPLKNISCIESNLSLMLPGGCQDKLVL